MHANIDTSQIKNSSCKRLVGINIHYRFSFENHTTQISTKARAIIKALARTAPFLNKGKRKLLINAFFKIKRCEIHSKFVNLYICIFTVNNRKTTKRCEICSELTLKTPERH